MSQRHARWVPICHQTCRSKKHHLLSKAPVTRKCRCSPSPPRGPRNQRTPTATLVPDLFVSRRARGKWLPGAPSFSPRTPLPSPSGLHPNLRSSHPPRSPTAPLSQTRLLPPGLLLSLLPTLWTGLSRGSHIPQVHPKPRLQRLLTFASGHTPAAHGPHCLQMGPTV